MRATTSRLGPASSSGSLNGCTDSATPAASSRSRCSSALPAATSYGTPCTSSRASTIAQPALASVTGSSSFLILVRLVLLGADWAIVLLSLSYGLGTGKDGAALLRLRDCGEC